MTAAHIASALAVKKVQINYQSTEVLSQYSQDPLIP